MPTIPGNDHSRHDATLADLRHRYPDWTIDPPAQLHVWTAELKSADGRSLHFLCGHDAAELAARLATATATP